MVRVKTALAAMTALLLIGGAAGAEPRKAAPVKRPQATQPAKASPEIVLASAEAVHVPAADPSPTTEAPKRHVAPRVTTCRCGDLQVDPETQDQ